MKLIKNSLNYILCILMIISIITTVNAANLMISSKTEVDADEKIYCDATIDDDFVDNHILVVMDRNVSAINKVYDFSSYRSISISKVTDLTEVDIPKLSTEIKLDE